MKLSKEQLSKAEPLRGQATSISKDGYGTLCEYQDYKEKPKHWSYFSTDDPVKLRPGLEMLLCSGCGFHIGIKDTAYKISKPVELVLSRGMQGTGPFAKDHEFFVDLTIETVDHDDEPARFTFKKPEEAIEKFFSLWEEYEIGDHWLI